MIGWLEVPAAPPDAAARRAALDCLSAGVMDPASVPRLTFAGGADPVATEHRLACALAAGRHAAERARLAGARLCVGRSGGSRVNARHLARCLSGATSTSVAATWNLLRQHGGPGLAALTGACLACAQMGLPILLADVAGAVAALTASRLRPGCAPWCLFAGAREPLARRILETLGARPELLYIWARPVYIVENDYHLEAAIMDQAVITARPTLALAPQPLADLAPGDTARLVRILGGREINRRLLGLGLRVGNAIRVEHRRGRGLVIASGETRIALGGGVVDKLLVQPLETETAAAGAISGAT